MKTENDIMASKLSSVGLGIDNLPASNQELPENVKALDAYNQRIKKVEVLIQKLPENPELDVEIYTQKAYNLLVNRKYNQAAELYEKILQNNPEDVEALLNKGIILYYLGKHAESILYYDRVLKIEPNNVLALHIKGSALWCTTKNIDAADEYYDKALKIDPNFEYSLWTKACNESRRENKDEALKYLKRAIKVDKRYKNFAHQDAAFKSMQDDPEFIRLTKNE
jgi:tetratricopeptide (TPR) repeat protein